MLLVDSPINSTHVSNHTLASGRQPLDLSRIGSPETGAVTSGLPDTGAVASGVPETGAVARGRQTIDLPETGAAAGSLQILDLPETGAVRPTVERRTHPPSLEDISSRSRLTSLESVDMSLTNIDKGFKCNCGKECTRYIASRQ